MALAWRCRGVAVALPWRCRGFSLSGDLALGSLPQAEVGRALGEQRLELSRVAMVQKSALEKELIEIKTEAAAKLAEEEAKAREERIELIRRQFARRMLNAELTRGFRGWADLWAARSYTLERLAACGHRLRAPALSAAFEGWAADLADARHERERVAMLKQNDSLSGQLRYAQYEMSQLQLLKTANEDELRALRQRVRRPPEHAGVRAAPVAFLA